MPRCRRPDAQLISPYVEPHVIGHTEAALLRRQLAQPYYMLEAVDTYELRPGTLLGQRSAVPPCSSPSRRSSELVVRMSGAGPAPLILQWPRWPKR